MAAEFVQRGRLCVEQGQLQEAVRVCRLGLLANPGDVEGRVVLGSALMALGRYDEVLGEMRSVLDHVPGHPSALALQGEALLRKGDAASAVAILEQAARGAPGDPYVEQLRAQAAAVAASAPASLHTVDIDPQLAGLDIHEIDTSMEVSADDLMEITPEPELLDSALLESSEGLTPVPTEDILTESSIEELDADLLTEATPTPFPSPLPLPSPSQQGVGTALQPARPVTPLPSPGIQEDDDGPFQDMRGTRVGGPPKSEAPETLEGDEVWTRPDVEALPAVDPPTPEPPTMEAPVLAPLPYAQPPIAAPQDPPTTPARGLVGAATRAVDKPASYERAESSIFEFDDEEETTGRPATIGTLFPDDDTPPPPSRPATIGTLFPEESTPAPKRAPSNRLATIGTLFPDDESEDPKTVDYDDHGAGRGPEVVSRHADMDVIRHGLSDPKGLASSEPRMSVQRASSRESLPPPPAPVPPEAAHPARGERRKVTAQAVPPVKKGKASKKKSKSPRKARRVPKAAWGAMTLLALAGGAAGGLKVREARLARQVETADKEVAALLQSDGYLATRKARDWVARIHGVVDNDESLARYAAAEARLAAEFGDSPERARQLLAMVAEKAQPGALEASAFLALADGDVSVALRDAAKLARLPGAGWSNHYIHARAQLLAGDGAAAKEAIDKAIASTPTLSGYVALARAEALVANFPEALAAIGRATALSEEHPVALIWQARILLASGDLPKNPSDPDDALAQVTVRAREGNDVSSSQGAWAGVVLAEIKLRRGDNDAARQALAEAKVGRPTDWMFSEMLTGVLIRLGEYEEALEEATRASASWPSRPKPRINRAQIRLAQGEPSAAIQVLDEVQGIEEFADALAVRGQAYLRLGKLSEAVTDLDRALALRPRFTEAVIARAQVDILQGRAKAAIGRLEPMYDKTAGPELAVAYAAALRTNGMPRKAREILTPLAGADGNLVGVIELAKLERLEGRYAEARKVFARAVKLDPDSWEAQLGAAELDIDDGRIDDGRKTLDALVASGVDNGAVLLACARARTLAGDTKGASELLDTVDAAWLGGAVARERGRILLRRLTPIEAISELQRAQSLQPNDTETRLLLMEAQLEARNQRGSARALEEITKSFRNSPVRASAAGLHALLTDRAEDAIAAFAEARSLLIDRKGSRLELSQVAYWLGRSYEVSGDLKQAMQWMQKAIKLNNSHALAHVWSGQIHHLEENPAQMVKSYEKAVAIDPGVAPMAWFFLGTHYNAEDKKDKAIEALEKFLQHYPENSGDIVVEAKVLLDSLRG